ncbi:26S proteasome non-ATPase regulatory subunit 12 [Fusarium pseudocircinatum]|uniref:26S proteasome non-ATPase regulatory subunit 12 n=1 Tax=Fusarium pseudocircinatum TaxID=56676 RepID=A0A8H5PU85_9HYPO|nr:26S proteasome non-ATPase regulatory subunit 12 [Fusarium pseudocircinatum]
MVFTPPDWVPHLPFGELDPPDSISIGEFLTNENFGRYPISKSRNPFTCGLTGRTFTTTEFNERKECLAKTLKQRLDWEPNTGSPFEKTACVHCVNTIDYLTVLLAIHRLNGLATPANAAHSVTELTHQLKSSGAVALFACASLLDTALEAAQAAGISHNAIFVVDVPGYKIDTPFKTVEAMIAEGVNLPDIERLQWTEGQGARQPAFLCYSSGTSGVPKAVMISHQNVISNVMQYRAHELVSREKLAIETQVELGVLPFSHIYGLVVIAHSAFYRGDEVIVLPQYQLRTVLRAISRFSINQLMLVPPMVHQIVTSSGELKGHCLDSVRCLYTGAAPISEDIMAQLKGLYPTWNITQGYGMTEATGLVTSTSEHDILPRSSGSLLTGTRVKIVGLDAKEIERYDEPGELLVQSPSVALGYLNNEKATAETFVFGKDGRWLKSGDEAVITRGPSGHEHVVIVDRIKELIKVKGFQVAPAELEAHLLTHPAVADCAVVRAFDEKAREVPKAFVVKSALVDTETDDKISHDIVSYVKEHKASYKWITGGVEFVDSIPKSPSGKILRRQLRAKATGDVAAASNRAKI